jgi:hypothetical protein
MAGDQGSVQVLDNGWPHVHFERVAQAVTIEKAETLDPGTGRDTNVVGGFSRLNQQGGGTPGSISRNLTPAAVRIPKLDGCRAAVVGIVDQNPAIGARAGVTIADRTSDSRGIASLHGEVFAPGKQEIVARSVRFCKRDLHLFAMVDIHVNISHRRSFHHNMPPQRVTGFLQRGIYFVARKSQPPLG